MLHVPKRANSNVVHFIIRSKSKHRYGTETLYNIAHTGEIRVILSHVISSFSMVDRREKRENDETGLFLVYMMELGR